VFVVVWVMVMEAPGIAAPVLSVTRPSTVPVGVCAIAKTPRQAIAIKQMAQRMFFMQFPFFMRSLFFMQPPLFKQPPGMPDFAGIVQGAALSWFTMVSKSQK
jgi:hypothetical protein